MSTFKKSLSTSIVIAMGFALPALSNAEDVKPVETEVEAVDCMTTAEIAALTDEKRANLTLPVCAEGMDTSEEKSVEEVIITK